MVWGWPFWYSLVICGNKNVSEEPKNIALTHELHFITKNEKIFFTRLLSSKHIIKSKCLTMENALYMYGDVLHLTFKPKTLKSNLTVSKPEMSKIRKWHKNADFENLAKQSLIDLRLFSNSWWRRSLSIRQKMFFALTRRFFISLSFRSGPDSDVGSVDDLPIDDDDGVAKNVTTDVTSKVTAGATYIGSFFSSAWTKTAKTANDATQGSSSFFSSALQKVGGKLRVL